MKKFELTDEHVEVLGKTLYRIRALKDFGNVKAREPGGFVEKEKNLQQSGTARVHGEAKVSGNAQVFGDAEVRGDARVRGDDKVYGDALLESRKGTEQKESRKRERRKHKAR